MSYVIKAIVLIIFFAPFFANAQQLEFQGYPVEKVSTDGKKTDRKELTKIESKEYIVTITKNGETYSWASRGNTPLIKIQSGVFITYLATNGAGYIRVIDPAVKPSLCNAEIKMLDCSFSYVEHMTQMLASITYYGN